LLGFLFLINVVLPSRLPLAKVPAVVVGGVGVGAFGAALATEVPPLGGGEATLCPFSFMFCALCLRHVPPASL
jgi:hypothetical protein